VELGQLAADRGAPVAELGEGVLEARQQAVGRLEEDQRVAERREPAIEGAALAGLGRREAGEGEGVGGEPRGDQRGEDRRRSGDRLDPVSRLDRRAHQRETGVGEQRRPRVGDHRDGLARRQRVEDPRQALPLVVLVQRDERLLHPQVGEQPARVAGVLAGDEVGLGQRARGARREVLEVADRGRDEEQPAGHRRNPTARGFDVGKSVAPPAGRRIRFRP